MRGTDNMPKRTNFELNTKAVQFNGKPLRMLKAYTNQDYYKHTALTEDKFTYVSFYYMTHQKSLKYNDVTLKTTYGSPKQYGYEFYWKQAKNFYDAYKSLPIESAPLAAYYCMLNAAKSYIAYKDKYVDLFVNDFNGHGLNEDNDDVGENLATIGIKRLGWGVFPHFAKLLDQDFDTKWPAGTSYNVKELLYNLIYVHRAYSMTYTSRSKRVQELFYPLHAGDMPKYYKSNDGKIYLGIQIEKGSSSFDSPTAKSAILASISEEFKFYEFDGEKSFLISIDGAKYNKGSISAEVKSLNNKLRKNFVYIQSDQRLWYLKKNRLSNSGILNVNDMTITIAIMHRISEIVRYKPEQLNRLMQSKENWLLHEFITLSVEQFIDEIACEITGQDIMCVGKKVL